MKQYFIPKAIEIYNNKSIYEFLGVKWFKKYLITDGDLVRRWRNVKQINTGKKSRINELYKAEKETKKYEVIHLLFLFIFFLIVGINYKNISTTNWIIILLINLYANIYPIFLQRHNRIRIIKLLTKNGFKSPYE